MAMSSKPSSARRDFFSPCYIDLKSNPPNAATLFTVVIRFYFFSLVTSFFDARFPGNGSESTVFLLFENAYNSLRFFSKCDIVYSATFCLVQCRSFTAGLSFSTFNPNSVALARYTRSSVMFDSSSLNFRRTASNVVVW